jgi:hypothetical protein
VKGHGTATAAVYLKQARLVTSLFGRTAWGSHPTR